MTCADGTCGTGGSNLPQSGDPDNNITLTARVVYSGIMVAFSYPLINPHAVAHTLLYRGLSDNFADAVQLAVVSGSSYLDRTDVAVDTQYFYWVEVVSIHGTRGARIGPVSAVARPLAKQTLETLTGLIDAGVLAETLRTNIGGITLNNQAIYQEVQDRLASNVALQDALAAVQGDVGQALTYILDETTARADADGAMVNQIEAIAAGLDSANAAIVTERTVRVSETEALAAENFALTARIEDAEGNIVQEREARVTAVSVVVEDYETLYGRVGVAEGAITEIKNLEISPDSALATKLENLTTDVGNAAAAVQDLDTALTTGTHALASSFKTVEAAVNGNTATGQTGLIAEVNSVTGQLDTMFFAKLEANGLIGGFGVWNNGAEVQAGFDVDSFWIGRTNDNKVKPFIVAGDKVYMDEAYIRTASIDHLKIKGEAVTVPVVSSVGWDKQGRGEGVWDSVNELYMELDEPGMVYVLVTANQAFIQNQRYWQMIIHINGEAVRNIMGRQPESGPVLSVVKALPAGVHKIEARWSGHPDVRLGYCDIFAMRVRK